MEATDWIPTAERFPPDNEAVLVHHWWTGSEVAYRQDGKWFLIWTNYQIGDDAYTHWMKLPEPPK